MVGRARPVACDGRPGAAGGTGYFGGIGGLPPDRRGMGPWRPTASRCRLSGGGARLRGSGV